MPGSGRRTGQPRAGRAAGGHPYARRIGRRQGALCRKDTPYAQGTGGEQYHRSAAQADSETARTHPSGREGARDHDEQEGWEGQALANSREPRDPHGEAL
jgi:hypothetical protein